MQTDYFSDNAVWQCAIADVMEYLQWNHRNAQEVAHAKTKWDAYYDQLSGTTRGWSAYPGNSFAPPWLTFTFNDTLVIGILGIQSALQGLKIFEDFNGTPYHENRIGTEHLPAAPYNSWFAAKNYILPFLSLPASINDCVLICHSWGTVIGQALIPYLYERQANDASIHQITFGGPKSCTPDQLKWFNAINRGRTRFKQTNYMNDKDIICFLPTRDTYELFLGEEIHESIPIKDLVSYASGGRFATGGLIGLRVKFYPPDNVEFTNLPSTNPVIEVLIRKGTYDLKRVFDNFADRGFMKSLIIEFLIKTFVGDKIPEPYASNPSRLAVDFYAENRWSRFSSGIVLKETGEQIANMWYSNTNTNPDIAVALDWALNNDPATSPHSLGNYLKRLLQVVKPEVAPPIYLTLPPKPFEQVSIATNIPALEGFIDNNVNIVLDVPRVSGFVYGNAVQKEITMIPNDLKLKTEWSRTQRKMNVTWMDKQVASFPLRSQAKTYAKIQNQALGRLDRLNDGGSIDQGQLVDALSSFLSSRYGG